MRHHFFLFTIAATVAALEFSALAQSTGGTGGATPAPVSVQRTVGFAVQDGVVYLVQRGTVNPVDESMLPQGQIMTVTGRLMPETLTDHGFMLEKGIVYRVDGPVRTRVDAGLIPGGQMMTLDGVVRSLPQGVTHFPGVQVITTPGPGPLPATSEPR